MEYTNDELQPVISLLNELKFKFENITQPKRYYRNKDLKKYFGLSDNTILDYRQKNKLPYSKIGDIYYYPIDEIEKLLIRNSNFDLFDNKFIR